MEKVKNNKMNALIKALIVILSYFIYTQLFASVLSLFNINIYSNWVILLITDLLFLVFCVYAYNDDIEEDTKKIKIDIKKNIITIFKYVGLVFLINFITAILTVLLSELLKTDITYANNDAINALNPIYKIFKTLIFSTIAETIVYHKTIKSVAPDSKWTYLLIAATFYGIMNIVYQPLTGVIDLYILLIYMLKALPACLLYNNKNNIVMIMGMIFICNFISLIANILGGGL